MHSLIHVRKAAKPSEVPATMAPVATYLPIGVWTLRRCASRKLLFELSEIGPAIHSPELPSLIQLPLAAQLLVELAGWLVVHFRE